MTSICFVVKREAADAVIEGIKKTASRVKLFVTFIPKCGADLLNSITECEQRQRDSTE